MAATQESSHPKDTGPRAQVLAMEKDLGARPWSSASLQARPARIRCRKPRTAASSSGWPGGCIKSRGRLENCPPQKSDWKTGQARVPEPENCSTGTWRKENPAVARSLTGPAPHHADAFASIACCSSSLWLMVARSRSSREPHHADAFASIACCSSSLWLMVARSRSSRETRLTGRCDGLFLPRPPKAKE